MQDAEVTPVESYPGYTESLPRPYKDGLLFSGKQALPYWDQIPGTLPDGAENPAKQRMFFVRRVRINADESHANKLILHEVCLQADGAMKFGVKHVIPETVDSKFYCQINELLGDLISSQAALSPQERVERGRTVQARLDQRRAKQSMNSGNANEDPFDAILCAEQHRPVSLRPFDHAAHEPALPARERVPVGGAMSKGFS